MATTIFNASSAPSDCRRRIRDHRCALCWGAHAPRVPAMAPSPSRTFRMSSCQKECFGGAPKPAREARALPRLFAASLHLLLVSLLVAFGMTACGRASTESSQSAQKKIWEDFSGEKALAHVQTMVDFGPRPPGTEAIEKTRAYLTKQLELFGWKVERQGFEDGSRVKRGEIGRASCRERV